MRKPWIGVDLDGTLVPGNHDPSTWNMFEVKDPIDVMVKKIHAVLARGVQVKIFTARVGGLYSANLNERFQAERVRAVIEAWSQEHFGFVLEVIAHKDMDMLELWDDRARQVVFNTGKHVGEYFGG